MNVVTFDKSARKFILESFNKTIDGEGYIVEGSNIKQRVLSSDGDVIRENEFAGVKKGSEVFIKSDLLSIIELSDQLQDSDENPR
ncbi:hypothetical protein HYU93_00250 [Candidatus Daviesbacteria bacterium]|nr:hypothetical protein [Candidatus Daviesbacteria bacterium]